MQKFLTTQEENVLTSILTVMNLQRNGLHVTDSLFSPKGIELSTFDIAYQGSKLNTTKVANDFKKFMNEYYPNRTGQLVVRSIHVRPLTEKNSIQRVTIQAGRD